MTPRARIASAFFRAAISRTTIGISNAPATRCSAMTEPGESARNSFDAYSTSPSTYWLLKRLATIAKCRLALEERGRRGASFDISALVRPRPGSKKMAHLGLLRLEIFCVMRVGFGSNRHLLDHLNAVTLETYNLFRIVGQESELAHTEIVKNLRAQSVIAQIGRETELRIGLDGIESFLLQLVSMNFCREADPAAFLPHIKEHAVSFLGDLAERCVKLVPAIASSRPEDIARQTFAVHAHERGARL